MVAPADEGKRFQFHRSDEVLKRQLAISNWYLWLDNCQLPGSSQALFQIDFNNQRCQHSSQFSEVFN